MEESEYGRRHYKKAVIVMWSKRTGYLLSCDNEKLLNGRRIKTYFIVAQAVAIKIPIVNGPPNVPVQKSACKLVDVHLCTVRHSELWPN